MQHLAIIPDGNRRWAAKNKIESFLGHQRGMDTVKSAISVCIKNSIKFLSFYTFSLENFKRSEIEKNYLFNLLSSGFSKEVPDLIKHGVKICFIGDRSRFPEKIKSVVEKVEEQTKHLDVLQLNLLFCYGATAEITDMAKRLAQRVKDGLLEIENIDETVVHQALWTGGIPDPDLIVRTGGVVRLSNFLLFQAAYSEFSFLNCYWPEVTESDLESCVQRFKITQQNFGK